MHLLPQELDLVKQGQLKVVFIKYDILMRSGQRLILLTGRFSVWRPLFTVENSPLVICDRRSVLKDDLMEVDKILADRVEKGYFLLHRENHQWHTLSSQAADEVAIFKSWSGDLSEMFAGE